jgi:hypothetical protein
MASTDPNSPENRPAARRSAEFRTPDRVPIMASAIGGSEGSKLSLLLPAAPVEAPEDDAEAILWKRVGPRAAAAASLRSLAPLLPPPPTQPLLPNPSKPRAAKLGGTNEQVSRLPPEQGAVAVATASPATMTSAASASAASAAAAGREDGDDDEPAPLTRAISSFGQNRILAMFGGSSGLAAAGRPRPPGREI